MFSSKVLISSALLAAAGAVSAQSISSGCQTALAGVLANPDAACLNPSGLLSVVSAGSNTSLVGPLDKWAKGVCGQSACSNAALASVVNSLLPACAAELKQFTGTDVSASDATTAVQSGYPVVREMLCLQDTSSQTLCPTQFLTSVETVTGPLTLTEVETLGSQIASGSNVPNLPSNITCTDCSKGWFNIVEKEAPGLLNSNVKDTVSQTCGASFVDGQTPATVSEFGTSGNSSGNTSNGAASSIAFSFAAVALPLVSSAFALLA